MRLNATLISAAMLAGCAHPRSPSSSGAAESATGTGPRGDSATHESRSPACDANYGTFIEVEQCECLGYTVLGGGFTSTAECPAGATVASIHSYEGGVCCNLGAPTQH